MKTAESIKKVVLTGHDLTLSQLVAVARFYCEVSIDEASMEKIRECRQRVDRITEDNQVAYGITTGFGGLSKVKVSTEMSRQLSNNLVLSHSVATGEPYREEQVRGMMLLLINAFCHGVSGLRPLVAETYVQMLNRNIVPVVPQKGSLGASGDLAPLSHIALVVLGKGEAFYKGERMPGAKAMRLAGIEPVDTLFSKEALAITNGTYAMTSVGALNLYDALDLIAMADVTAALSLSALTGQLDAFDPRIHQERGQKGQQKTAENIRILTEENQMLKDSQGLRVQDSYSLRCIPQVHGAIRDALAYVREKTDIELNAVTDNPLIFEDGDVVSGGNFHGEPMALAYDFLGIALSEIASISERRIEKMVNSAISNGLTCFLTTDPGINSGFMIVQYSAASMVSENKVLAHPASVDSIPSSANQEDFVSMGTTAARKSGWILENSTSVLAYELLTACQAIDIRRRLGQVSPQLSPVLEGVYRLVREDIDFMETDREIRIDIAKIEKLIRSGKILETVRKYMPDFE
ncbi:MAG: histidine ammonia-lyase [Erysipelotrichaceae bacterium]|nr:histidine ammonia-lyase [Erysipelotrichaceae bacterium]